MVDHTPILESSTESGYFPYIYLFSKHDTSRISDKKMNLILVILNEL